MAYCPLHDVTLLSLASDFSRDLFPLKDLAISFVCLPASMEMPFPSSQLKCFSPYCKYSFTCMTLWNYLKMISALKYLYCSSFKYQSLTNSRSKNACLMIVYCPQNSAESQTLILTFSVLFSKWL